MGQTRGQLAKEPTHTRIYRRQMQSPAWLHLSGSAVKVLLSLASLEKGENNGAVFLSDRKGSELTGLSRNTVWKALRELVDKGFIYCSEQGGFRRKTAYAACYGITWAAGPKGSIWRAPSHAYEQWQPENGNTLAQLLTETGPISDNSMETRLHAGAGFGPVEMETRLNSTNHGESGIGPHTSNQGEEADTGQSGNRKHLPHPRSTFLDGLRNQLIEHLKISAIGEQSKLARSIDCPQGTLSKFISGRSLPQRHSARLAAALTRAVAPPWAPSTKPRPILTVGSRTSKHVAEPEAVAIRERI